MAKRPKTIQRPECGGTAALETRTDMVEYKGTAASRKARPGASAGVIQGGRVVARRTTAARLRSSRRRGR